MKTLVAFVLTACSDGRRTYSAFTRDAQKVGSWTVHDHGHGAHLAQQACAAKFRISTATWTHKIADAFRPRATAL